MFFTNKLKIILVLTFFPFIMNAQIQEKNQAIVWKSSFINTTEFTTIKTGKSIIVDGYITGEGFGKLFQVSYKLTIDPKWQIEAFHIELLSDTSFSLSFQKNRNNQWVNEQGELLADLNECTDIDISLTPFTNTLPIKRLNLPVGASKEITVIYIDLPSNRYQPVKQRYTNLDNGIYKYENLESGFTSMLEVDKDGIVINYPGIWHRVFPENEKKLRLKEVFSDALFSLHPNVELSEPAKIYDWLIGSWDVDVIDYLEDNKTLHTQGEWHFSWVLEGRAIEDVWIAPKRSLRTCIPAQPRNRYGISFRYFDDKKQKWCVNWFNPISGSSDKLYGRKEGENIIHEGLDDDGNLMRWSFEDITANSFHWKGEISYDKGKTFVLQAEFFGKRR